MASSSLPAILSTKPTLSPESMTISTQTIDPTICTDSHAQFRLPKVGVLDAGSTITLAVTRSGAADDLFFPIATGIHSSSKQADANAYSHIAFTSKPKEIMTRLPSKRIARTRARTIA